MTRAEAIGMRTGLVASNEQQGHDSVVHLRSARLLAWSISLPLKPGIAQKNKQKTFGARVASKRATAAFPNLLNANHSIACSLTPERFAIVARDCNPASDHASLAAGGGRRDDIVHDQMRGDVGVTDTPPSAKTRLKGCGPFAKITRLIACRCPLRTLSNECFVAVAIFSDAQRPTLQLVFR